MLELYGRQWESSYGHVDGDVFPTWCDALAGLKPEKIKGGLDAVIAEGNQYPPNLIKFLRLCRTAPDASHKKYEPLPRPKTKYSVVRIERAKQRALTGQAFSVQPETGQLVMDWNADDEAALCDLLARWDDATGLEGLNILIDRYPFSQGTHESKTRLL